MARRNQIRSPRIVTIDIETAPLESFTWDIWDQNISLDQIGVEWAIISFAAKWIGDPQVVCHNTGGRGVDKVRDDLLLMSSLWKILDEADIVIAQNGKKFDIRKINARLLLHGFKPYSPFKLIDTMQVAKKHFAFTSNKLEWMSKHLTRAKKLKHRKFPGFELWLECLKDNPLAWVEMIKYNCVDVIATEQLYIVMRPWIEGHPNVGQYSEGRKPTCPKCGSINIQHRGRTYTQSGEYVRYRCNECKGWSRSRYTLNSIIKRHNMLSN